MSAGGCGTHPSWRPAWLSAACTNCCCPPPKPKTPTPTSPRWMQCCACGRWWRCMFEQPADNAGRSDQPARAMGQAKAAASRLPPAGRPGGNNESLTPGQERSFPVSSLPAPCNKCKLFSAAGISDDKHELNAHQRRGNAARFSCCPLPWPLCWDILTSCVTPAFLTPPLFPTHPISLSQNFPCLPTRLSTAAQMRPPS